MEIPPTVKAIVGVEHSIIEHIQTGEEYNKIHPAPDQRFFEGFIQGLKVALSITDAHKRNEHSKVLRKLSREENKNVIPYG